MNPPTASAANPSVPVSAAKRRMALGLAVSILVHGALLSVWRGGWLPPAAPAEPPRTLAVWVRTLPPPAPPQAILPPPPPAPSRPRASHPHPHPRPSVRAMPDAPPTPVIALEPHAVPAPVFQVAPAPPAQPVPRFDPEAARRLARQQANDLGDPARAGLPVAQLDTKPVYTEPDDSKLARSIAAAKRPKCKDGLPGGLLGPIIIMFDKKDSGCKW